MDGESLPAALLAAFSTGRQTQVPLVIGTNAPEGLSFLLSAQATGSEILPVNPDTMRATLGEPAAADVVSVVSVGYAGFPEPEASAQADGDMVLWSPSTVFADAHAAVAPTRMYRFDRVCADPRFGGLGAAHGTEIPFVFGRAAAVLQAEEASADDTDMVFAGRVMDRWLAFARGGEPGGEGVAALLGGAARGPGARRSFRR